MQRSVEDGEIKLAFDKWQIVPRMLRDVSQRDLSIELFGTRLAAPVLLAPVGVQGIVNAEAEVASGKAAASAGVLFAVLVHAVLVALHLSEPAATTVYGVTPRRVWATTVVLLAMAGVFIGGLALARPASRLGTDAGQLGAIVALMAGLIAVVNGGLNLATANGGPGSGNGVVGAAAAFVLGLIALALGGLALARCRRIALEPRRMT